MWGWCWKPQGDSAGLLALAQPVGDVNSPSFGHSPATWAGYCAKNQTDVGSREPQNTCLSSGARPSCGKELWKSLGRSSSDHGSIKIYAAEPKRWGWGEGGRDPRAAISCDEVRRVQGAAPLLPPSHTLESSTKQWSSCSGSNTPTSRSLALAYGTGTVSVKQMIQLVRSNGVE